MSEKILSVENLTIHYKTDDGLVRAVNDVTFDLNKGETIGLVGETGAGKTSIALGIMGLLPVPPAVVDSGTITFEGKNLLDFSSNITLKQGETNIIIGMLKTI